jgi:hypothetical protein
MASASLVKWLAFSGARDVTGAPVASGLAYFYVVGSTSTAVQAYSDYQATTPLAQPVTLDAAGRAKVYLKVRSEIVIKTSAGGAVQLSEDGTGVDAGQVVVASWGGGGSPASDVGTVLTAIETSVGVGAQYLESSSTGAVARSVHDVLHSSISPYDFAAAGNGTTDDTVAVQRAINRAIATNVPLHLEAGTYKVTAGLTVAAPLNIIGDGADNSVIAASAETFDVFTINTAADEDGYEWKDFAVTQGMTASSGFHAIRITDGANGRFTGLHVQGEGGIIDASGYCIFTDCVVQSRETGITLDTYSTARNCRVTSTVLASSIGIHIGDTGAAAYDCYTHDCADGFYFGAGLAVNCIANTCTNGFRLYGSNSGAIGCRSITCTTEFTNAADPSVPINIGNSWQSAHAANYVIKSSSSATPSFEFDPTKEINVFRLTYSGAASAIAITWPSSPPTIIRGTPYMIVFQCDVGTTFSGTVTWPTGNEIEGSAGGAITAMAQSSSTMARFTVGTLAASTVLIQTQSWHYTLCAGWGP